MVVFAVMTPDLMLAGETPAPRQSFSTSRSTHWTMLSHSASLLPESACSMRVTTSAPNRDCGFFCAA